MYQFSIIVPCYNEKENLTCLAGEFCKLVMKGYSLQLVLVNNGSRDGSADTFIKLAEEYPFIKLVTVEVNQGYGFGILSGLALADGEYLGWMHADLQFYPGELCRAMDFIREKRKGRKLFIKGRRRNRPVSDQIFTVGMSLYESLYLHCRLWDINAQPVLFHRSFYDSWENPPYDFSLDLYVYYKAVKEGFTVLRYPVKQHNRRHGKSSWNDGFRSRIKLVKRVLQYSKNLKRNTG